MSYTRMVYYILRGPEWYIIIKRTRVEYNILRGPEWYNKF